MHLKTFEAPTLEIALRQVREAFGNDALIVSTDKVGKNGPVRVTAARERVVESDGRNAPAAIHENGTPVGDPVPMLRRALADSGVDGDLATTVLAAAHQVQTPVVPAIALAAAFDACYRFRPLTTQDGTGLLKNDGKKSLILIGPPGAGKTVTAAKLAARAQLSGLSVRTVSADTHKTGGPEQLEALACRLTIGATTTESAAELNAVVSGNQADFTVIDTFGVNPFDETDMVELDALIAAAHAEPVLVLPAGIESLDARDMVAAFSGIGCQRAIVTRIDLTRRLGSLLNAFHVNAMSFADVSVSPDILPAGSGGLRPLNPVALARLLLPDPSPAAGTVSSTISNSRVLAA